MSRLSACGLFFLASFSASAATFMPFTQALARPWALGGAFTAVADSGSSHLYNPAATVFNPKNKADSRFLMNMDLTRIIGGFVYGIDSIIKDFAPLEPGKPGSYGWMGLGMLWPGMMFSSDRLQVKLTPIDGMPLREAVGEVPDATSEATTISAAFALRGILSGFQIGGAYHFYNRFAKPAAHDGFSAGLFYRAPDEASWLSLGFFYFYAPDNLAVRRPVDGLAHDSFNIGIAFDFDFVQLSIDLRNIGDYGEEGGFHFGVEYSRVFDPEMGGVLRFGAFSNSSQSFQDHAGFSFGAVLRFVPREWGRADETRRALTRDQAFIEMGITRVHDNLYGNYWFISFGGWFFPF